MNELWLHPHFITFSTKTQRLLAGEYIKRSIRVKKLIEQIHMYINHFIHCERTCLAKNMYLYVLVNFVV